MRGLDHDGPIDALDEARACCTIMSAKEFVILATVVLLAIDAFDVYGNVVRVSGWTDMPFPGNHTELYYTAVPEMSYYDMGISIADFFSVLVLSLAACGESLDGLVCSLCAFASCMCLEFIYVVWLCVAVGTDATQEVRLLHH